jgi:hypothetical protein
MVVDLDERSDYGEDRWIGTGLLDQCDRPSVTNVSAVMAIAHQ